MNFVISYDCPIHTVPAPPTSFTFIVCYRSRPLLCVVFCTFYICTKYNKIENRRQIIALFDACDLMSFCYCFLVASSCNGSLMSVFLTLLHILPVSVNEKSDPVHGTVLLSADRNDPRLSV